MIRKIFLLTAILPGLLSAQNPSASQVLDRVDRNMASESRIFTASMVIHAPRGERVMEMKVWSEGDKRSFTEYLTPARDKGTKMLKLDDQLWMFSPAADRTIQISGHMLRQSVMGSDLSYEDMMEDSRLTDKYKAETVGTETLDGRKCYVLELTAVVADVNYFRRKTWIDCERYVPLKEELYAKSGQLLKQTVLGGVKQVQGRWFPTTIIYKDMLKAGDGTEFRMTSIAFDQVIPEYIFSKAALKK